MSKNLLSPKSVVGAFSEARKAYDEDRFGDVRADYDGMESSKYVRERRNLGGSADAHLSMSWARYWRLREYARDMMRNDGIVGQAVERAADNVMGDGFQLDMLTPDTGLNTTIDEMYLDWANDALQCDAREISTFDEIANLTLRQTDFDGDLFHNPMSEGCLQTVEGDRCVGIKSNDKKNVHGVLLGERDEPIQYFFAKPEAGNRRMMHLQLPVDTFPVGAKTADGERAVFHMFRRNRFSMTRGVPVFAPVISICGMLDDLNFAKLVQAQVVSCIAAFLEMTDPAAKPGSVKIGATINNQVASDGHLEVAQSVSPGKIIQLPAGRTLKAFSPQVPNSEYFEHTRFLMRIIGVNLGMPLTLVMLDSSDTNFSGWRAEMEQARVGFRKRQKWLINGLYRPVLRWKIRNWIVNGKLKGPTVGKLLKSGEIFKHKWTPSGWPYIDPSKDATADTIIQEGMLDSPRGIQNRKGRDIADVRRETIEDNGATITDAIVMSQAILKATGVEVSWRDVLNPHDAKVQIKVASADDGEQGETSQTPANKNQAAPKAAPKKKEANA